MCSCKILANSITKVFVNSMGSTIPKTRILILELHVLLTNYSYKKTIYLHGTGTARVDKFCQIYSIKFNPMS